MSEKENITKEDLKYILTQKGGFYKYYNQQCMGSDLIYGTGMRTCDIENCLCADMCWRMPKGFLC